MALCQHMVGDGFEPGCPAELDPLADRADMVMTHSDGVTLEIRLLFDGTAGPRLVPYERDEVLDVGAAARRYTDSAWGIDGPVRVAFWLVGDFPTGIVEDVRRRLSTRRSGYGNVIIDVWHVAPGQHLETGRPLAGRLDDAEVVRDWATRAEPPAPDLEPAAHPLVSSGWLFFALAFVATFASQELLRIGPQPGILRLSPGTAHALGGADASAFREWYRFCTAMFLHDGLVHLLGNLGTLALSAAVAEQLVGRLQTAAVLCTGGATGALLCAAFGDPSTVSVGASAGIVAVLVYAWGATQLRPHRRLRLVAVGRLRLVAVIAVAGTVAGGTSATIAHVSGALTGVVWVLASWHAWRPRAHPVMQRQSAAIVVVFAAVVGWGMLELRADFSSRAQSLVALEHLMADDDLARLRTASIVTVREAVEVYPEDPRVRYVLAHKYLEEADYPSALTGGEEALARLTPLGDLFASGTLEGAIRQVRVLAAEGGGVSGVIPDERDELCGRLAETPSGQWASERGLCD